MPKGRVTPAKVAAAGAAAKKGKKGKEASVSAAAKAVPKAPLAPEPPKQKQKEMKKKKHEKTQADEEGGGRGSSKVHLTHDEKRHMKYIRNKIRDKVELTAEEKAYATAHNIHLEKAMIKPDGTKMGPQDVKEISKAKNQ